MKIENRNKRTKRKEIQFNEAEYAVVEQKANAARLSVAAFIRKWKIQCKLPPKTKRFCPLVLK